MGNLLKHQYLDVDSDVVWETLTQHLTPLHRVIKRLLDEAEAPV